MLLCDFRKSGPTHHGQENGRLVSQEDTREKEKKKKKEQNTPIRFLCT